MKCNLLIVAIALMSAAAALAQTSGNVGRTPTAEETRAWDLAVGPEGKELPPGSGTAKEGAAIYASKCAACHGANGDDGQAPPLYGAKGKIDELHHAVRTVGNYWPYATMIWDYINRAMPLNQGLSLKPDDVFALTAFLLYKDGVIHETDVINAQTLPKIPMPNRNNYRHPPSNWKPGMSGPFQGTQ